MAKITKKQKKFEEHISKESDVVLPLRPLWQIALGIILLLTLSLLLGFLLQNNHYTLPFDSFFYELARQFPHMAWLNALIWPFDNNFLPIGRPHPSYLIVIYILFLTYIYLKKRTAIRWALLSLIWGFVVARTLVAVDTALVFRERPFTVLPNTISSAVKEGLLHWTSYPSGHTRDAMLFGTIVAWYIPGAKYLMWGIALFVGFSRVYLGVHYPTDVLSGLLLGYLGGMAALFLTGYCQKRFSQHYKSK